MPIRRSLRVRRLGQGRYWVYRQQRADLMTDNSPGSMWVAYRLRSGCPAFLERLDMVFLDAAGGLCLK